MRKRDKGEKTEEKDSGGNNDGGKNRYYKRGSGTEGEGLRWWKGRSAGKAEMGVEVS